MPIHFNFVATGTSTSLKKFVNSQNIGDGLATRLSCFLMPEGRFKMRPYNANPYFSGSSIPGKYDFQDFDFKAALGSRWR